VLQASSTSQPVSVVVTVHLFPAGAETMYRGAFLSGFIGTVGKQGYETKVDYKVQPGDHPTGVAVAGLVTSKPGQYPFKMALFAEVPGRTDPYQFQQTFNVRVIPADNSAD
jgi:hypothetical protein